MRNPVARAFAALLLAALLMAGALVWLRAGGLAPPQNVVVLLVDTLRADHLGTYGYERDTSPAIDALAERGTVFNSAYSVSNWTTPAIKSIFTGRTPQALMHDARHEIASRVPLPTELTTLAELLREGGYRTAALVDHPGIKPWGQYDQGFEHYSMLYEGGVPDGRGWGKSNTDYVAEQFGERLDEYRDGPFLIYLHVVYPHRPYLPPEPYRGMFGDDSYEEYEETFRDNLVNAYDAEIRRTDDLTARIHAALEGRDLLDRTWVLLTSDHGEGFWEHGFDEHGQVFYDEMIRVPMILLPPPGGSALPARVDAPVSNLDVFTTVLEIAGIEPPAGTEGFSLLGAASRSGAASRILYSESPHSYDIHARAILRDEIKYAYYPSRRRKLQDFLFDLRSDPLELDNLYGTRPEIESQLQALLESHRQRAEGERERLTQSPVEPDADTLEGLRALGYIQ